MIRSNYRLLRAFGELVRAAWMPVVVVALLVYGVVWYNRLPDVPPGVTVEAKPAPELKGLVAVPLAIDLVKVFPSEAKQKLKLPAHVQADATQHVVASIRTPADERPHTVTTTLDTSTGEFSSYDRAEPLPWLAISTRRHFGAYVGAMNGEQAIAITARQEALRIKGVSVEGVAFVGISQSERFSFVGVGASW